MSIRLTVIAAMVLMAGCQDNTTPEVETKGGSTTVSLPAGPRTQEFFFAHDKERIEVLKKCKTATVAYQPQIECGEAVLAQSRVDRAATIKRRLGK